MANMALPSKAFLANRDLPAMLPARGGLQAGILLLQTKIVIVSYLRLTTGSREEGNPVFISARFLEVCEDNRDYGLQFPKQGGHYGTDFPVSRFSCPYGEDVPPFPPVGGDNDFCSDTDRKNLPGVLRVPSVFS